MNQLTDNDIHERLEQLMARRQTRTDKDVRYKGKPTPQTWDKWIIY